MVASVSFREHPVVDDIAVRRIGTRDLYAALREGWADFTAMRGEILLIAALYPAVGLLAAAMASDRDLLPLLFPLVAGLTLLGPAVASGFYELARRRERGDDPGWRHFLDVVRSPSIVSIGALTVVLLAAFLLWLSAAWSIYAATLGPEAPASAGSFVRDLFGTAEGWRLIVLGNLAGLAFAAFVLAFSVVSFPMLVDRRVSAISAVQTSFRATRRNPGAVGLWGLIVAGLLAIGSIPLFVGLIVVLPWLGYSTWHLYRRLVED